MSFEIGSWVKWGEVCPTRLGHQASEIGRVVDVYEFEPQGFEIDVEFDNGEVVRAPSRVGLNRPCHIPKTHAIGNPPQRHVGPLTVFRPSCLR